MSVDDATFAWNCAADLLLYDANPRDRHVNVANRFEARVVDRRDALNDVFARQVLVYCEADPDRLAAAHTECSRSRRSDRGMYGPKGVTQPLTHHPQAEVWAVAEELVSMALSVISDADAVEDPRARARLLVSAVHACTRDMLGEFLPPEIERRSVHELSQRLQAIDHTPGRRSGNRGEPTEENPEPE